MFNAASFELENLVHIYRTFMMHSLLLLLLLIKIIISINYNNTGIYKVPFPKVTRPQEHDTIQFK